MFLYSPIFYNCIWEQVWTDVRGLDYTDLLYQGVFMIYN